MGRGLTLRSRLLAAGVVAVVIILIGAVAFMVRGDAVAQARRQTLDQEIPGSLTLSLGRVPEGFRPTISADEAFRIAWDEPVGTTTYLTLAVMQDSYYGNDATPDWVFISRAQCYPSAKGDIVSPARSGTPGGGCDDRNLAVVTVDALKGEPAEAFTGYDPTSRWHPANAEPVFTEEQMHQAGGGGAPDG